MNIIPGIYLHYKNKKYKVLGVAKHSEALDDFVIYEALYDNHESKFWVRPLNNFLEEVEIDGKLVPRFKYLESGD